MAPSSPNLVRYKTIGRYEVLRLLGSGAMGRVLLAHDPVLDRQVAVKVLREDLHIPEDVREGLIVRMRHEARAAARVSHPNLVVLFDMGEDEEAGLYLVFEYLEGDTLKARLRERRLTPKEADRIARELGNALTLAHDKGVLHRDVKPENIILTPTGAKLTDFGIARVPDSTLTHAGGIIGTPAYSAPETFRDSKFSPKSDQFSLAATLYEAVSGERAFPGDDAVTVAAKIANDEPLPFAKARGFTKELDEVLARALSKDAAGRFDSCDAFGRAMSKALRTRPTSATSERPPERDTTTGGGDRPSFPTERPRTKVPPKERSPWAVIAVGVVVVLALAFIVRSLLDGDNPPVVRASAEASSSAMESAEPAAVKKPRPAIVKPKPEPTLTPSVTPTASTTTAPHVPDHAVPTASPAVSSAPSAVVSPTP